MNFCIATKPLRKNTQPHFDRLEPVLSEVTKDQILPELTLKRGTNESLQS